jgi:hypothetical protein
MPREPLQRPGVLRQLPTHLKMRHPARDKHQVSRPRANYPTGDIDVADPPEPRLSNLGHDQAPMYQSFSLDAQ